MRRLLLVAAVAGTPLAAGCYSAYPVFPRLQTGFGCGYAGCGGPIINRPVLNRPILLPSAGIPVYPAVSDGGYPVGGDVGLPIGSGLPIGGGPISGVPASGCSGCGAGSVSAGYPSGTAEGPLPTVPYGQTHEPVGYPGVPIGYPTGAMGAPYPATPQGYPGVGVPPTPAPMPMVMPSAMPGGVPHDSALLKMPTIMPPTVVKRPEELARDSGGRK